MDAHPLDAELASKIGGAVARKKRGMFAAFRDLSKDDLQQHGVLCALQAQHSFNPDKAAQSTFLWGVMARRLIDLWRRRDCEAGHVRKLGVPAPPPAPDDDDLPEPADLAEWCGNNYANARRTFGPKLYRLGREFHSVAQLAAVVLLMNKMELTPAETVQLLREEPDVARSLRFMHVPNEGYFSKAATLLAQAQERVRVPTVAASAGGNAGTSTTC